IGRSRSGPAALAHADDSMLPDLVGVSLQSLLTRVARLEDLESIADGPRVGRVIRPPEAGIWHGEDFSI
ncbi:MAG TPA: serine O-acetyltransferase, partial [Mycobacterium sp.]|nr:serine O-acetyltransferase [Mycobacterium sp.]